MVRYKPPMTIYHYELNELNELGSQLNSLNSFISYPHSPSNSPFRQSPLVSTAVPLYPGPIPPDGGAGGTQAVSAGRVARGQRN